LAAGILRPTNPQPDSRGGKRCVSPSCHVEADEELAARRRQMGAGARHLSLVQISDERLSARESQGDSHGPGEPDRHRVRGSDRSRERIALERDGATPERVGRDRVLRHPAPPTVISSPCFGRMAFVSSSLAYRVCSPPPPPAVRPGRRSAPRICVRIRRPSRGLLCPPGPGLGRRLASRSGRLPS
jgi:hypothetical protein